MHLLIDNYDSFTFNLYDLMVQQGLSVEVLKNDQVAVSNLIKMVESESLESIVISPGPGRPKDAGKCLDVVRHFSSCVPILGICLGHQVIAEAFQSAVVRAAAPIHGRVETMTHVGDPLFDGIDRQFTATRYHSLLVDQDTLVDIEPICFSNSNEVMAIRHKELPVVGIQFHPESYGTKLGGQMLKNFLNHYVYDFAYDQKVCS